MLYGGCSAHIKRKHMAGCTTTIYNVPEFVPGRPTFDHSHAVRYVTEKLRRGGFDVLPDDNGVLAIDWSKGVRRAMRTTTKSASKEKEKVKKTPEKKKDTEPLSVRLANLSKSLRLSR